MRIVQAHLGELAALANAVCFTITSVAYEKAGKRVGSLAVSFLRLFIAFIALGFTAYFTRGIVLPFDADAHTWIWLLTSGFVGFVIGDMFLFQAFIEIGSRISLLIMSTASPIAAIVGFFAVGERISLIEFFGILVTMGGIGLVIMSRSPSGGKFLLNRPARGIAFASIGALGQALGLVCSKIGIGVYNPFAATQIRLIAAIIGFITIITFRHRWPEIFAALGDKVAMSAITLGSVFGPFLGVTLALIALKYTATGIVSSISSISPILIIPASIIFFKEKVLPKEIYGAFITITGVVLLFL